RGARLLRRGRESPRGQFVLAVEGQGLAVHRADERALPAADHGIAQLAAGFAHRASRAKAASKAPAAGLKSRRRQNAALSVAPCTRSMRLSSHSTDSGPA